MAFHPRRLPAPVKAEFDKSKHAGGALWPNVVDAAVCAGITYPDSLADIVFYLFHPELIGKALTPGMPNYQQLSQERLGIRVMVRARAERRPQGFKISKYGVVPEDREALRLGLRRD